MKTIIYFAVSFFAGGLLVYLFCFWKKYRAKKEIEQGHLEEDSFVLDIDRGDPIFIDKD